MSDPAGWYPDPVGRADFRFWDGLAWTSRSSSGGVAVEDRLGGAPLASPSDGASDAAQPAGEPPVPAARSRRKLVVCISVVAVLVVVAVVAMTQRDDKSLPSLSARPASFTDRIDDLGHLPVHRVSIPANTATFIDIRTTDTSLLPIVVIEASKATSDQIATTLVGATDESTRLRDLFPDLREEDLGVQGSVIVFACAPATANGGLIAVMPSAVGGEYDVVPVLLDGDNNRHQGEATLTLRTEPFDYTNLPTAADVASASIRTPSCTSAAAEDSAMLATERRLAARLQPSTGDEADRRRRARVSGARRRRSRRLPGDDR